MTDSIADFDLALKNESERLDFVDGTLAGCEICSVVFSVTCVGCNYSEFIYRSSEVDHLSQRTFNVDLCGVVYEKILERFRLELRKTSFCSKRGSRRPPALKCVPFERKKWLPAMTGIEYKRRHEL